MQTQQILGVVGGGMRYPSKTTSAKSSETSFEQLIQMSQNVGNASDTAKKPAETTKQDAAAPVKEAEKPETTTDVATDKADTSATAEEKPELTKAEGAKEATDVEAAERAAGILAQVTEVVKDILDLTDEQLSSFMEELGITDLNLLNPETLQNLALLANSEQDAVVLLTDAELLSTVNQLINEVEQVLQEAGVTAEELFDAMDDPEFETLVNEAMGMLAEEVPDKEVSTEVESNPEIEAMQDTEDVAAVKAEGRETDTSAKQDSKESTDVEQFTNQFVQNLQQAAEEIGEITGQKDMVQLIREVADQILEKVKVSVTPETTSLEIVLTPEELGRVNLTVSAEQDGTMKAKFVTENELAREAIERNLVQFKEMLQEQGLKVDNIEVTVGNFEFDKNGQAGENAQEEKKNSNRGFLMDDEIGQNDDADQLAKIFMEGGESTVNYMA